MKKKPGCFAHLLASGLLLAFCVVGLKKCGDHVFAPETPEQTAKREQTEKAEAQAEAERWAKEEAKQPERRNFIQSLIDRGVFAKVDFGSRSATIWVDTAFYLLEFDAKTEFCRVVYAYAVTNARDELVVVTIKDNRTGTTMGDYGQQWTGIGLKMK